MTIKTTCPYCGVGCGVLIGSGGEVSGDPDHPANFGRLCSKGSALGETLDLEGRLLAPQIGGRSADWNVALDLVADRFTQAISKHGPDSVAFYVSGQLLTEDYYVANKLMKGYIGSANIDTNSRLCMASSVAGHKRAFGTDTVPGTYEDLEQADLIVLVGSNLAWCHPVLHQRIASAKSARPQMRVVNIDPRRTASSELADLHLQIALDGDVALFSGLLTEIVAREAWDRQFVADHVDGFDGAIATARQVDLVATGLAPDDLEAFYNMWIGTKKVVTVYSQGVNQSRSGTDKVNAILNCHLATGRIGTPGCGPFSVTGQPNAMGGREVGGLANMLGMHLDIENADHRAAIQGAWQSPTMCTKPGLKAVDLFEACADGRIKALWVMSTNPAVSMPDADRVAEAIATVPFTVVSDIMARTDTGDLADVILPAAGWGEKDGTVTNSERRISRQRAFLPKPGDTRPDWRIMCDVAARMGWGEAFAYDSPAEIFREYAELSKVSRAFGKDFDITGLAGLTDEDYAAFAPVQWPVPEEGAPGGRFFADGGFYNPGGKARMIPTQPPAAAPQTGLRLNTGRIRDQWHTMTRTGKSPILGQHQAEPYVEIHPDDAKRLGIELADLIELRAEQGGGIYRALHSEKVQPGQLFVPMHWTRQRSRSSWVNRSVKAETDPVSGQPALKASAVKAVRFEAAWYGFVASAEPLELSTDYGAISKTKTGWQAEIADRSLPTDWPGFLSALTGCDADDLSLFEDSSTGQLRAALQRGDVLQALFFAAPEPVAVGRPHIVSLIGTKTTPLSALAGRPTGDVPDPGATVCSCLSVGLNTLKGAIADGCNSVDALGEATGAGTNCGSCKPELAALLTGVTLPLAAE